MRTVHVASLVLGWWCCLAVAFVTAADQDQPRGFPKGSEKAVEAVRKAVPKADVDEAVEPKGLFGSGGKGKPLFWNVRFHVGDNKQELSVTPEGVIIRLPVPVAIKDLPKAIADAVAKAAPGEKVQRAEKQELRATLKYVALDRPQVRQYTVDVSKDGKTTRYTVSPDGKTVKASDIKPEKKSEKPAKELDIPAKAAKAVAAIKSLYPDAVVKLITHEVFDDGSGDLEILTYEIEFVTKGVEREMVASPEGVIPHLWVPVAVKQLPQAVIEALAKAAPGAKAEKARAFELRAALRFGAVENVKVYYTVQVEKDGKSRTLKFKTNGEPIKAFQFPKGK
jgi:hypothetical protein